MAENADAFIALPGGYGTLEEVMEMITWQQLGLHAKPVGFLNVNGLYTKLLSFFDDIVASVSSSDAAFVPAIKALCWQ